MRSMLPHPGEGCETLAAHDLRDAVAELLDLEVGVVATPPAQLRKSEDRRGTVGKGHCTFVVTKRFGGFERET